MVAEVMFGRAQYEELINKYFIPSQAHKIMMAYRFSKYGHRGQERDGGGRYFDHPREVSLTLLQQGLYDHETIIAALLHDVMEDTFILTWEDLEYIFGRQVCILVKSLSKEPGLPKEDYLPRLSNGLPQAWAIKLADRLHNLSTLDGCTREKQLKQVKETREKIMPLAHKLAAQPQFAALGQWFATQLEKCCQEYE